MLCRKFMICSGMTELFAFKSSASKGSSTQLEKPIIEGTYGTAANDDIVVCCISTWRAKGFAVKLLNGGNSVIRTSNSQDNQGKPDVELHCFDWREAWGLGEHGSIWKITTVLHSSL